MGKKVKKKSRSGPKDKRGPSLSPTTLPQDVTSNAETPENGVVVIKDRGVCSHVDKGINLEKLSVKLKSSESSRCEDCRGNAADRRSKKGQGGKHGKKAKSETKGIWVCLECGHYACGGVGLPNTPQTHAVRHSKQNHHPLVVNYENHHLRWCFMCDKLVLGENSDDPKHKEVLQEVVKLLKGQAGEGSSIDVEDVWFGSGSVTSAMQSDYSVTTDGKGGYLVRGLCNLGNTCFFNSVMQNLLALSTLRDYYFKLDESIGPLSAAMRKLFVETSNEAGSKGVINPRSLFGSLCTKAPQFRGYQQHDSHELLRCLLDGMSTEELSFRKHSKSCEISVKDPTFVDVVFGGQLSSTVSCLECGHSSTIFEPFLDLSLPVPTKKPPPKKNQPPIRGKKPKLPPRRSARIHSKVNKEANSLPRESILDQSSGGNSPGNVNSIAQPAEELVGDSAFSDSTNPNNVALDMGLSADDLSAFQNLEFGPANQAVKEQTVSSDVFTWLDYLDPSPASHEFDADTASEVNDTSAIHDSANEDARQLDVSSSVTSDSRVESNLENLVPESPLDIDALDQEQNASLQFEDEQNIKPDSEERILPDVSFTEDRDEHDGGIDQCFPSCSQVCANNSNTPGRDNDNSSQILDTEVMSCQNKEAATSSGDIVMSCQNQEAATSSGEIVMSCQNREAAISSGEIVMSCQNREAAISSGEIVMSCQNREAATSSGEIVMSCQNREAATSSGEIIGDTEVSSAVVGNVQDSLEFDGFGDMFNEPEEFSGSKPTENPGSVVSESDADEVDNADAPVTVESCLAFFMKPEFLCKDEHAWQCDNCSKILREQRLKSRKVKKSDTLPNGIEDRNPSGLLDDGKSCDTVETMNGNQEGEVDPSDSGSLPHSREISENGKCKVENHVGTEIKGTEFQSENMEFQPTNACPDSSECSNNQSLNPYQGECDSKKDGSVESDLRPVKRESEVKGHKDVELENLKVKRDATKSILINKAPAILTIHLKRFSQDARGRLSKLNGHVSFKETIHLKPYMDPRCREDSVSPYRLVGVVEHLGTMRGGHYVAYVRSRDGAWYHASDAYVRQASLEEVLRCEAYILFYERT